ncbi:MULTISPECIES: hypothetical protein [unclassified Nocardia]|uniref:hypothetical protein n=1 Tax=unclassified Nocardia TaxID=2637762 RepID=UPI0033B64F10
MSDFVPDIPFRVVDPRNELARNGNDVSELVIKAVVMALQYPVVTAIKEVVLSVHRASIEIQVAMQDARVAKRVALQSVTAKRFNDCLMQLHADNGWHPEVRQMLEDSLVEDLAKELRRIRVT